MSCFNNLHYNLFQIMWHSDDVAWNKFGFWQIIFNMLQVQFSQSHFQFKPKKWPCFSSSGQLALVISKAFSLNEKQSAFSYLVKPTNLYLFFAVTSHQFDNAGHLSSPWTRGKEDYFTWVFRLPVTSMRSMVGKCLAVERWWTSLVYFI